jgi:hypothetical protein
MYTYTHAVYAAIANNKSEKQEIETIFYIADCCRSLDGYMIE